MRQRPQTRSNPAARRTKEETNKDCWSSLGSWDSTVPLLNNSFQRHPCLLVSPSCPSIRRRKRKLTSHQWNHLSKALFFYVLFRSLSTFSFILAHRGRGLLSAHQRQPASKLLAVYKGPWNVIFLFSTFVQFEPFLPDLFVWYFSYSACVS